MSRWVLVGTILVDKQISLGRRVGVPGYTKVGVPDYTKVGVPDYMRVGVPDDMRVGVPDYMRVGVPDTRVLLDQVPSHLNHMVGQHVSTVPHVY